MGKVTDFKFGQYIQRIHLNKIPLKILEKSKRGHIQGLPNFSRVPPIISGTAKAVIFKFCTHIYRLYRNKSPLKISGKVAMGIVRDSRKFSGHPCLWRIARSSLWQLSFLVLYLYVFQRYCHFCAPELHNSHPSSSLPQNSACSPWSRWMASGLRRAVYWAIVCAVSFKDFQLMWSWFTYVTDRWTDDMRSQDRALHCSASITR